MTGGAGAHGHQARLGPLLGASVTARAVELSCRVSLMTESDGLHLAFGITRSSAGAGPSEGGDDGDEEQ